MQHQVHILGASIDRVTLDDAIQTIKSFVISGKPHQVVTVNLDFLRIAQENSEFRGIINRSALSVADGMPLVWASHWLGRGTLPERVTGVELVAECCKLAAREGYRVFLLGGAEGVPQAAAAKLMADYPGLQVVGTYSPPMGPFSDAENQKMVGLIRAAQADLLFVGFGAPKQDLWIAQHQAACGAPVAIGVGGVFNFVIGRVRRAPRWMQHSGMEWLYRVVQEPRRLWRRYFVQDLPVLARVAAQAVQVRTSSLSADLGFGPLVEAPRSSVPVGTLPGYPLDPPQ